MIQLTPEQAAEIRGHAGAIECSVQGTGEVLVIVGAGDEILQRLRSLYESDVREAIAEGVAQMESGQGLTVAEAQQQARRACGFAGTDANGDSETE